MTHILTTLTLPMSHTACFLLQFKKAVVDRLTKTSTLPVSHIGMRWKSSSVPAQSGVARRIDLLGMKGRHNYFSIFLPEETVQLEKNKDLGECLCACVCVCLHFEE